MSQLETCKRKEHCTWAISLPPRLLLYSSPRLRWQTWCWSCRWETPSHETVSTAKCAAASTRTTLYFSPSGFPSICALLNLFFFPHIYTSGTNIWMCLYFPPYLWMLVWKHQCIYYFLYFFFSYFNFIFKLHLRKTCQTEKNHLQGKNILKIRMKGGKKKKTSANVLLFLTPRTRHGAYIRYFSCMLYMCKLYHGQNHEHCSNTRKYAVFFVLYSTIEQLKGRALVRWF